MLAWLGTCSGRFSDGIRRNRFHVQIGFSCAKPQQRKALFNGRLNRRQLLVQLLETLLQLN